MKKSLLFCLSAVLLASCGTRTQTADTEPDVAITRISGPLLATQQGPESGGAGGGSVGTNYDPANLLKPGSGPITVAASSLYDPVSGQTDENPLSVYVVASDESNVEKVELFQNGSPIGTRTKAEDGIVFKNPFVFPKPGGAQTSVQLQGTPSGMLSTQLTAVATDSAGQTKESAPLTLQVDGSRPNLSVSVSGGDGAPYSSTDLITLSGSASDPETGIASFDVTLNGAPIAVDASNSFTTNQTLPAGSYTLLLTAINGVFVPNQLISTFEVVEAAPANPDPGNPTGNQSPTVSLSAVPQTDDPLSVDFTANANDPENDALTYTYSFGDGTTVQGERTISHTYAVAGSYSASVTVDDGNGGTASDTVNITVGDSSSGGNGGGSNGGGSGGGGAAAPSISSFTANGQSSVDVAPNTEVTLAWSISGTATKVTISANPGANTDVTSDDDQQLTVTPAQTTSYTITAENGSATPATQTVTVTVTGGGSNQNPAVSIDGDDPRSATVGESQDLGASTSNLGDNVTYQWRVKAGTVANVSFGDATAEDTTVSFSAAETYTLELTAQDSAGNTASDSVTVTVTAGGGSGAGNGADNNNGGVDAKDDRKSTTRNKAVTLNVLANDKPSVKALTIIAVTAPQRGGRVEITRDSRNIIYTPPGGFTGTDTFKYTVSGGRGYTDRATVTIVVR